MIRQLYFNIERPGIIYFATLERDNKTNAEEYIISEIKDINLQRERQLQYNKVHGLLSTTIHDSFLYVELSEEVKNMTDQQRKDYVSTLKERLMIEIKDLNFNEAAKIKAEIETIKEYFQ